MFMDFVKGLDAYWAFKV